MSGVKHFFRSGILTVVARSHPRVQIEATVARNAGLIGLVSSGRVDLGLAWDVGSSTAHSQLVRELPMRWIGRADSTSSPPNDPLSLAVPEPPCLMRSAAIKALDGASIPWRVAFTSSSLSGIWAAVSAGLGITVRTGVGLPKQLRVLDGFPELPRIGLILHRADSRPDPLVTQLETILLERLDNLLSAG